ncbi:hypothetical protein AVEN_272702-1 [Araneus ventricosus]|uniref:Uncharacterized protein n=1 Tax=Araneus ventricosus TaxID=182803 RepID=A0A4Y2LEJ4_ARAVE|nr:hypothetical protein AVEN_272702-1 [Araneus ventricosus]
MRLRKLFPKHPKCTIDRGRGWYREEKRKIRLFLKTLEKIIKQSCCWEERTPRRNPERDLLECNKRVTYRGVPDNFSQPGKQYASSYGAKAAFSQ